MSTKQRKRYSLEQIVRKLRDADAMLHSGKELSAMLHRWKRAKTATSSIWGMKTDGAGSAHHERYNRSVSRAKAFLSSLARTR